MNESLNQIAHVRSEEEKLATDGFKVEAKEAPKPEKKKSHHHGKHVKKHAAEGLYMNELLNGKPIGVTTNAEGDAITAAELIKMGAVVKDNSGVDFINQEGDAHIGYKSGGEAFNEVTKDIIRAKGGDVSQESIQKEYDSFSAEGTTDSSSVGNYIAKETASVKVEVTKPHAVILGTCLVGGVAAFYGLRRYTRFKSWEIIAVTGIATIAAYLIGEKTLNK